MRVEGSRLQAKAAFQKAFKTLYLMLNEFFDGLCLRLHNVLDQKEGALCYSYDHNFDSMFYPCLLMNLKKKTHLMKASLDVTATSDLSLASHQFIGN
jgi:hypothetical protein